MSGARTLSVQSGQGTYDVDFSASIADVVAQILSFADPFVVIDANVAAIYADVFAPLAGLPVLHVRATEDEKTLDGVAGVCAFLQTFDASKKSTLVAIGGGIVQDVTTFAAHIYYRGIAYVYIPTTLLSMSDSCIGAKCALNFGTAKNQIGFFQSPKRVLIAVDFLASLSDDDVRSGFGEIVKLALIGSAEEYAYVRDALTNAGFRASANVETIARSLCIKRATIEIDEYEAGPRKILNYGHTFGHALEAISNHAVPHGIAVAWGCDLVNYIALSLGLLPAQTYDDVHALLRENFSFYLPSEYDARALVEKVKRDKKASQGVVQLILMSSPGDLRIVPTPIDDDLVTIVDTYLHTKDIFRKAAITSSVRS